MKKFIAILLLSLVSIYSQATPPLPYTEAVTVNTNMALQGFSTNLFSTNIVTLTNALNHSGYSSGSGSGNTAFATNATYASQATNNQYGQPFGNAAGANTNALQGTFNGSGGISNAQVAVRVSGVIGTTNLPAGVVTNLSEVHVHPNGTLDYNGQTNTWSGTKLALDQIQQLWNPYNTNNLWSGIKVIYDAGEYDFVPPVIITNTIEIGGAGMGGTVFKNVGPTNYATAQTVMAHPYAAALIAVTTNAINYAPAISPAWPQFVIMHDFAIVSSNVPAIMLYLDGNNFEMYRVCLSGPDFSSAGVNYHTLSASGPSFTNACLIGIFANMATEISVHDNYFYELADGIDQNGNSYFYSFKNNYSCIGDKSSAYAYSGVARTCYAATNYYSLGAAVIMEGNGFLNSLREDQTYYCNMCWAVIAGLTFIDNWVDQGSSYGIGYSASSTLFYGNCQSSHPLNFITNSLGGAWGVDTNAIYNNGSYELGDTIQAITTSTGEAATPSGDTGISWWFGNQLAFVWDNNLAGSIGGPAQFVIPPYTVLIANGTGVTNISVANLAKGNTSTSNNFVGTLTMHMNTWNLSNATNGMLDGDVRFTMSNRAPVAITWTNGGTIINYIQSGSGGIIP